MEVNNNEEDIEMGNQISKNNNDVNTNNNENNVSSSYLCCSDDETKDDSSVETFRDTNENKYMIDEDDLGDNEDELQQIKVNFDNKVEFKNPTFGNFDMSKNFKKHGQERGQGQGQGQ